MLTAVGPTYPRLHEQADSASDVVGESELAGQFVHLASLMVGLYVPASQSVHVASTTLRVPFMLG